MAAGGGPAAAHTKMNTQEQYKKSLLNAYTNANQTLTTDGVIRFNNVNVDDGCSIDFTPGATTIALGKPGVYLITMDASVSDSGTPGVVTMQLYRNGVGINGATSTITTTASTSIYPLSVTTLVKVLPSCCAIDNTANITVVNTGVGAIYANANITVIKLC